MDCLVGRAVVVQVGLHQLVVLEHQVKVFLVQVQYLLNLMGKIHIVVAEVVDQVPQVLQALTHHLTAVRVALEPHHLYLAHQ
jgi:hypothetical protein